MPAKRTSKPKPTAVDFELPGCIEAEWVALCGEFNDWSSETILMARDEEGAWKATVLLPPGGTYRYRYLIDGSRWENSWSAPEYVPNPFGSEDSVIQV
jgi:1,4-alpha-glucan branching enzyme